MWRKLFLCLCLVAGAVCADPRANLVEQLGKIVDGNAALDEGYVQVHPDAILTSVELIAKYGYFGESHRVYTEDDYILEVHRISGSERSPPQAGKPVVFLMHGLLGDSANFILSGPEKGLAFILADAGFDVWLGNARGNTYSRKHVSMTTADKDYWYFSWHEIGVYDLPAMIDFALQATGQADLFYIGHSQGCTSFLVMASQRTDYQQKIKAMFALAPAAYCGRMPNPLFQALSLVHHNINLVSKFIGFYEFEPTSECMTELATKMCDDESITQPICHNIIFLIGGFDKDSLNMTLLPVILGHAPAGASVRQFLHYAQLIKSGRFRQFDHGLIRNMKKYGTPMPPKYDLSAIKIPLYIFYGTNDRLVDVRDIHRLVNELGGPVAKFRVPDDRFGHLEFLWGNKAKDYVYDKVFSLMTRHMSN